MCRNNSRALGTIYKTVLKHLGQVIAETQSVLSSSLRNITVLGTEWETA
jgi:hypothetical protein